MVRNGWQGFGTGWCAAAFFMHTGPKRKVSAKLTGPGAVVKAGFAAVAAKKSGVFYQNTTGNTTMGEWIFPGKYRMLKVSLLERFPDFFGS